ncbi:MAG: DUF4147 domain-containing protein, partial [Pseudomonadales bacterium]|nr:DUF4147 domain-containing protein [Pseudomonadales bacterium]
MSPRDRLAAWFAAGVDAAQPARWLARFGHLQGDVWTVDDPAQPLAVRMPGTGGRVHVLGAGKAVVPFADALVAQLGGRVHGGVVVTRQGYARKHASTCLRILEAAHPVPDATSEIAAGVLEAYVTSLAAADLVFFLVTGGASALLAAPAPGVTLADKQATTRALLRGGADIHAINRVRKHLSRLKGGRLAERVFPARLVTLAVSDVPGDDPAVIGSGPTVPDPSTYAEALADLHALPNAVDVPASVLRHLAAGAAGAMRETPKPGAACFANTMYRMVANLDAALVGITRAAACQVARLPGTLTGDVVECAQRVAGAVESLPVNPALPRLLLAGGEPTVTVSGNAPGGRAQHLALLLARRLAGRAGVSILVAGSDGSDGTTTAAGAFADGASLTRAAALGLDVDAALDAFAAHEVFARLGDLFVTGPTGTNVNDIV